jgi:hypothetical protein
LCKGDGRPDWCPESGLPGPGISFSLPSAQCSLLTQHVHTQPHDLTSTTCPAPPRVLPAPPAHPPRPALPLISLLSGRCRPVNVPASALPVCAVWEAGGGGRGRCVLDFTWFFPLRLCVLACARTCPPRRVSVWPSYLPSQRQDWRRCAGAVPQCAGPAPKATPISQTPSQWRYLQAVLLTTTQATPSRVLLLCCRCCCAVFVAVVVVVARVAAVVRVVSVIWQLTVSPMCVSECEVTRSPW